MKQKKLTRKEKMTYTQDGICWKCKSKYVKKESHLVCSKCGYSPPT